MGWSERQLAMLGEMGVRVWQVPPAVPEAPLPPLAPAPAAEARVEVAAPASRPLPRPEAARPPVAPPLPTAAVPSIGTLGWEPLREAVAGCTACKLCEDRQQAVVGIGHERAHWMIVGEAPGEQEDREGEPFVGKPGELLDNMLRAVGLTRHDAPPGEQVYLTHAVKCRPSGNRGAAPTCGARSPWCGRASSSPWAAWRCSPCCRAASRWAACAAGCTAATRCRWS